MGMYTEIIFGAGLRENVPKEVVGIIQKLVDGIDVNGEEVHHPFFESERRYLLTSGGSYYFPGTVPPRFWYDKIAKQWYLQFRTNVKNYDDVIGKFLHWIKPYLEDGSGYNNFYAIVTYEESRIPTVYYLKEE